jgi:hypothetical protein
MTTIEFKKPRMNDDSIETVMIDPTEVIDKGGIEIGIGFVMSTVNDIIKSGCIVYYSMRKLVNINVDGKCIHMINIDSIKVLSNGKEVGAVSF